MKSSSEHTVLRITAYAFLLTVLSLLVFQRHQHTGYFNWRSKMWGDAAGYYVYSPALFIYGFDGSALPENIVQKTGEGFTLSDKGRIITRYTCGVAILQAPVFLAVHFFAGLTGQKQDGFSGIYHWVSDVAAVLYAFIGLILLWRYLRHYFNKSVVLLSMTTIFLGTNLLYYTIDATGMSHVYSFFLFALLLLLTKKYFAETKSRGKTIGFIRISLVSALIILIRPTNIAFVGLAFLLDISNRKDFFIRIKQVFNPAGIIILLLSCALVFLPQLFYWKYASGSFFSDPYKGYGFTNWASPRIAEFLFAPNNGLFLYNPVYIIIVFSLFLMMIRKQFNGYLILTAFAGLIYIFSSWFVFSFGCGFGSRNFAEYTAVFALPLGFLFRETDNFSGAWRKVVILVTVLMVLVNLKLVSAYDKCFLGKDWDFKEYCYFLESRSCHKHILGWKPQELNSAKEFSEAIRVNLKKSTLVNYRRALVSVKARLFDAHDGSMIVISITAGDSTIYWNGFPLKNSYNFDKSGEVQKITGDFWLPRYFTSNSVISTYIWNRDKDSLQVSDLKIHLR